MKALLKKLFHKKEQQPTKFINIYNSDVDIVLEVFRDNIRVYNSIKIGRVKGIKKEDMENLHITVKEDMTERKINTTSIVIEFDPSTTVEDKFLLALARDITRRVFSDQYIQYKFRLGNPVKGNDGKYSVEIAKIHN